MHHSASIHKNIGSYATHEIVGCLNELTNQLDAFESVEGTVPKALRCIVKYIPMYSIIVIQRLYGNMTINAWHSENPDLEILGRSIESAKNTLDYLVGTFGSKTSQPETEISRHELSLINDFVKVLPVEDHGHHVAIPLKVGNSQIFGILQIHSIHSVGETSLGLINAMANRLSMSMDRDFIIKKQQKLIESEKLAQIKALQVQKQNDEVCAANTAKSQFLANMSHEIRTPLGVILGFAELLATTENSDGDRDLYFSTIRKNGQLLTHLIDDILDLSKVEEGKIALESHEFSLPSLLADVKAAFASQARDKDIGFTIEVANNLPENIISDPYRLKQIIFNIVSNAFKFTDQGKVVVEVRKSEAPDLNKIVFSITDTGRGITPDEQARLFQPFTQADNSTTRKYGGSGLGLALSKRIAVAMGGDVILLWSERGKGSSFNVTILAEFTTGQNSAYGEPNSDVSFTELSGASVLLVDDAGDNLMLFTALLQGHGAKVDTASDGNEAIMKVMDKKYDIILMDLQMPQKDGFDAAFELRRNGFKKPILALSALAMKEERQKALTAGCSDHMAKPVNAYQLVRKVTEMIGHNNLH